MTGRLPNFFVVGAAKAGTTAVVDWLRDHPQVAISSRKEVYFFNREDNWARGLDWYRSHFAGAGDAVAVGEGTPTTMMFAKALERLHDTIPDVRLVAVLRNPVDRFYSNWRHVYFRTAADTRPLQEIVEAELAEDPALPGRDACRLEEIRYLSMGRYAEQIELIHERFGPEQLLVVFSEELREDGPRELARICRHLGIDAGEASTRAPVRSNEHAAFRPVWLWHRIVRRRLLEPFPDPVKGWVVRRMRRSGPPQPLDPAMRERLDAYFAEPNARLAELLGRALPPGWALPGRPSGAP